jgi:hypothetical protein
MDPNKKQSFAAQILPNQYRHDSCEHLKPAVAFQQCMVSLI